MSTATKATATTRKMQRAQWRCSGRMVDGCSIIIMEDDWGWFIDPSVVPSVAHQPVRLKPIAENRRPRHSLLRNRRVVVDNSVESIIATIISSLMTLAMTLVVVGIIAGMWTCLVRGMRKVGWYIYLILGSSVGALVRICQAQVRLFIK